MPIPGNLLSSVTEMVDPNTSGWTAWTNTTIALGTGGRSGNGCLLVKSVASGEMRARTASSYKVTQGTVYQAFADASGVTVPERIGIRWLNIFSAEISITWGLTTATASSTWHRIGVAGVAPPSATRAQVVVSASPVAALVINYFENVYFGLPIRAPGNMLPFEAESPEVDTSKWVAEANTTLSRTAPTVSWGVTVYGPGGQVFTLTTTANGNSSAAVVEHLVVTPGVDYMAQCYLSPPTAASATWIELRFYDASAALIATSRAQLAASTTGWLRQRVSLVAPPTAATCTVAVGITGATAGQVTRAENVVLGPADVIQTGSVVPYADASFEQGIGTWTRTTGVATIARSTPWGASGLNGAYSLTFTSATATASTLTSGVWQLPAGAGGKGFRLRMSLQVTAGGWTATMGVRWFDAVGTDLGLSSWPATAVPTGGWFNFSFDTGDAPAGAAQAAAEVVFTATATSSVLQVDKVSLWQTLSQSSVEVLAFSASIRLTLRELTADRLLRLYRVTGASERTLVRGPAGLFDGTLIVADTMVIEDYEAPLGVPLRYYEEFVNTTTGVVGNRTTSTVTIPHDDINVAWIKDPGNPQRNAKVVVEKRPVWARPIDQASYVVKNRKNKVTRSGLRNGREGDLIIWTTSDEERQGFDWLLDSGNTLLWQTGPGVGVGNMYVTVGQTSESAEGQPADDAFRTWTLPLVETDMPVTTGVNGSAGRTWQDILSEFGTWQEVRDAFATWEALLLNKRLE